MVRPIKAGEIVWRLNTDEPKLTNKELLALPEHEQSLAFQFKNTYIICHDGSEFMNHSCDPNTWWVSDTEFAARRDIGQGEEVTYDYVTADVAHPWVSTWVCHCGSVSCRHHISDEDCHNPTWQETYRGHLPSWVMEHIRRERKEV